MRVWLLPSVFVLSMVAYAADAKQKNYKRQTVDLQGTRVDVQRTDQFMKNSGKWRSVVILSYRTKAFAAAGTGTIRLDTTGAELIRQVTGCEPVPGLIPPGQIMGRNIAYAEIEVTCP